MLKTKNSSACLLAATVLSLVVIAGCGPPANGVQVQVNGTLDDAQIETVKSKLKDLAPDATSTGHSSVNGKVSFNLSPVDDVQKFADSIKFGTLENVNKEERTIVITIDTATLE
ncbi:MAG: hypothetical protein ACI9G1_004360 [Pirellulaceae bacterium]|jgi:hypothetical protein